MSRALRKRVSEHARQALVQPGSGEPYPAIWFWLIPCLTAMLTCFRSLDFGFVFDDRRQILLNPQIQSWAYLTRLLTTHVWSQKAVETLVPQYRPVFSVWLLIIYSFAGGREWAWHSVSIALYALTTYLVYCLADELLQNCVAACIATSVFAVHPIHIEAVCWVSACNELLVGPLVLISLIFFHKGVRVNCELFGNRWTLFSLLAWTVALFTKENVLPVVAVFPYLAWRMTKSSASSKERTKAVVLRAAPYLAAALLYLAVRLAVLGKVGLGNGSHTWAQVVYSAPSLLAFYIQKLIVPTGLSSFYLTPLASSASIKICVVGGLITIALILLGWLSGRKDPLIGVAAILLLAPLLPVLVAVKNFQNGDTAHDRYLFLPSIGLCLYVGIAVKTLLETSTARRAAVLAGSLVVIVCFASLTVAQEGFYRNEESYFGRALAINPANVLIMDYLGDSYMRDGRNSEALSLFQRAHSFAPEDSNATFCLARGLYYHNQFTVAEPLLESLDHAPGLSPSRRFIGKMLLVQDELRLDRPDQAEALLKQLASNNPGAVGVHYTLGSIYEVQRRLSDAQREYILEYQISGNSLAGQRALSLDRKLYPNYSTQIPSRLQTLRGPLISGPEQWNGVE